MAGNPGQQVQAGSAFSQAAPMVDWLEANGLTSLHFNTLNRLDDMGPSAVRSIQKQLSNAGLYTSAGHRYYQDGIAGEVTQHAVSLATEQGYASTYLDRTALVDNDLGEAETMKLQAALNRAGYDSGNVDGIMGPQTARATAEYVADHPEMASRLSQTIQQDLSDHLSRHEMREIFAAQPAALSNLEIPEARPVADSASVDIAVATPRTQGILDMIADAEHSRTGHIQYNTAYGNRTVDFENMTVDEVIAWQEVNNPPGLGTAAAGRYQIVQPTLEGLKRNMGLDGDELFDAEMQDKMAIALLQEKGLDRFLAGDMSASQFLEGVAQVWAGVPRDASGLSNYHDDGINGATISHEQAHAALQQAQQQPEPEPTQVASSQVNFSQVAPQAAQTADSIHLTRGTSVSRDLDDAQGLQTSGTSFTMASLGLDPQPVEGPQPDAPSRERRLDQESAPSFDLEM